VEIQDIYEGSVWRAHPHSLCVSSPGEPIFTPVLGWDMIQYLKGASNGFLVMLFKLRLNPYFGVLVNEKLYMRFGLYYCCAVSEG